MNSSLSSVDYHKLRDAAIERADVPEPVIQAFFKEIFAIPSQRRYINKEHGVIEVEPVAEGQLRVLCDADMLERACIRPILSQYTDGFISYADSTAYIRQQQGTVAYISVESTEDNAFVFPRDVSVRVQTPVSADMARSACTT